MSKAEYMRQYRARPNSRGRIGARVRSEARTQALQWARHEHPIVWQTLHWVASTQCPGYPPQKVRNRAEVLLLSWVRMQHPAVWGALLDAAWAEVGGTLPGGAPRSRLPRNT